MTRYNEVPHITNSSRALDNSVIPRLYCILVFWFVSGSFGIKSSASHRLHLLMQMIVTLSSPRDFRLPPRFRWAAALFKIVLFLTTLYACRMSEHLIAKDESCRQGAVVALRNLAHQCSSEEALETLLSHLVDVLNGSEGKLSTTEQRLGVLTAFGEVSCHVVTGASHVQHLSETAVKHLLVILKNEDELPTNLLLFEQTQSIHSACGYFAYL